MNKDAEHLRYLSIGFYVYGALTALFSLFPLIHVTIGILIATGNFAEGENPPPPFFGWMFAGVGATIIVIGMTMAVLNIIAGRFISKRKGYIFCFVMAAVACAFAPFGTVLGVFTIIVLLRDPVKEMFGRSIG